MSFTDLTETELIVYEMILRSVNDGGERSLHRELLIWKECRD